MLSHEDGVATPGGLLAIVFGMGGGESLRDKVGGVGHDPVEATLGEIGSVGGVQLELPTKRRLGKRGG